MTMLEELIARARALGPEQQKRLVEYAEALVRDEAAGATKQARRNAKGALAHLGVRLREEDLEEVRREMWAKFPRDLEP